MTPRKTTATLAETLRVPRAVPCTSLSCDKSLKNPRSSDTGSRSQLQKPLPRVQGQGELSIPERVNGRAGIQTQADTNSKMHTREHQAFLWKQNWGMTGSQGRGIYEYEY